MIRKTCVHSPQNPCQLSMGESCLGFRFRGACVHVATGNSYWIDLVQAHGLNGLSDPEPRSDSNPDLARVQRCEHRSNGCCGSTAGICALGRGLDGTVELADCLQCPDIPK